MKKEVARYNKSLVNKTKALEESTTAIVEKDRLIALLRKHLREEAELEDEEDGTRSPRRYVFSRVATNNLEAARKEIDEHARKHQEL
jgi:hypothetical protein